MFRTTMKLCLLAGLLCMGTVWAKLEDHLKEIPNKTSGHNMKGIDFIYMINLDSRPERFLESVGKLAPYGIVPFRFSAVNGRQLSIDEINDLGVRYASGMTTDLMGQYFPDDGISPPVTEPMHVVGRTYFCAKYCMSRGAIGCSLSHLSILQDAYRSGYKTVWIMEDDISVIQNPLLISKVIKKLDRLVGKKGWDMLFTDQDYIDVRTGLRVINGSFAERPNFTPENKGRFGKRSRVGKIFDKIGSRFGTHSYIIRRSGMKKLLNFFKKYSLFGPIDLDMALPPDIHMYAVVDDIVSVKLNSTSDIR